MATFEHRGTQWRARITRKNFPIQRKTFPTKTLAKAWARRIEHQMDSGAWIDTRESEFVFIDNIVDKLIYSFTRHGLEVAVPKMSQLTQLKEHFKQFSIHDLSVDDVLDFATMRRETVGASTLQQQLYYLRQAVNNSRIQTKENVIQQAIDELKLKKLIMGSKRRERRLEEGEYELLMSGAASQKKSSYMPLAIDLAIETAMRLGELHALEKSKIDFNKQTVRVMRKDKDAPGGKTEHVIPLFNSAIEALLRAQKYHDGRDRVFHVRSAKSFSFAFSKLTAYCGIVDLHFHDLRHEGISRMFEVRKMPIEEVRFMSGHKSFEELSRYTNLRAENLRR